MSEKKIISLTDNLNNKVVRWPQFNPMAIEIAMGSRGVTVSELKNATGIKYISDLIKGNKEATEEDIRKIGVALGYPSGFFEQYFETTICWEDCPKGLAYNKPVIYSDYPIFMENKFF